MTKRTNKPPDAQQKRTMLQIPCTEAQKRVQDQIDQGIALLETPINSPEELVNLEKKETIWSAFNKELLRQIVDTDNLVNSCIRTVSFVSWNAPSFEDRIRDF